MDGRGLRRGNGGGVDSSSPKVRIPGSAVLLLGGLCIEMSLVPQRLGILCPAAPLGKPRGQPLDLQVKRCAAGQSMT